MRRHSLCDMAHHSLARGLAVLWRPRRARQSVVHSRHEVCCSRREVVDVLTQQGADLLRLCQHRVVRIHTVRVCALMGAPRLRQLPLQGGEQALRKALWWSRTVGR